jgi:hypothetical protein
MAHGRSCWSVDDCERGFTALPEVVHALGALDADLGFQDQVERRARIAASLRVAQQGEQFGVAPCVCGNAAGLAQGQLRFEGKDFGPRVEGRAHGAAHRTQETLALELANLELAGEAQGVGCLLAGEDTLHIPPGFAGAFCPIGRRWCHQRTLRQTAGVTKYSAGFHRGFIGVPHLGESESIGLR